MIKTRALGNSMTKIIYSNDCQNILSIPTEEVLNQFNSSGLLLYSIISSVTYSKAGLKSQESNV